MKKSDELAAGGYVNDALTCSSLDITNPKDGIPHGSQSGSDEFICEYRIRRLIGWTSVINNIICITIAVTDDGKKVSQNSYLENIQYFCKERARATFKQKILYKRLPILQWLPK